MTEQQSLSNALRSETHDLHEVLDKRVMQLNPFADSEHYRGFLRMQLRLHTAAEPLYHNTILLDLIPDLSGRSRLNAVLADCKDVGLNKTLLTEDQRIASYIKIANEHEGIGWLYALEGSTLGAAMLLKHVKNQLKLSEDFGASHMAAHSDGRATHWKQFKAMLDQLKLTQTQREKALTGATQAFLFVTDAVNDLMTDDAIAS